MAIVNSYLDITRGYLRSTLPGCSWLVEGIIYRKPFRNSEPPKKKTMVKTMDFASEFPTNPVISSNSLGHPTAAASASLDETSPEPGLDRW